MELSYESAYLLTIESPDTDPFTTYTAYVGSAAFVTPKGTPSRAISLRIASYAFPGKRGLFVVVEDTPELLKLRAIFDVPAGRDTTWTFRPVTVESWRANGGTGIPEEYLCDAFLVSQVREEIAPDGAPDHPPAAYAAAELADVSRYRE